MKEIQHTDSDQPRRRTCRNAEGFPPIGQIVERLVADLIVHRVAMLCS
jgi:hypothetical protein